MRFGWKRSRTLLKFRRLLEQHELTKAIFEAAESGLVHSVHVTSAIESDVANTHALLHGQETRVHADSRYTGAAKREEIVKAQAEGCMCAGIKGWPRLRAGRRPRRCAQAR